MPAVEITLLRRRAVAKLTEVGTSRRDAEVLVDHMLTADLVGRSSHGLSVRFPHILRQAQEGVGQNTAQVAQDRGHVVLVDANNGFGYAAALACTELLIDRTQQGAAHCLLHVTDGRHGRRRQPVQHPLERLCCAPFYGS